MKLHTNLIRLVRISFTLNFLYLRKISFECRRPISLLKVSAYLNWMITPELWIIIMSSKRTASYRWWSSWSHSTRQNPTTRHLAIDHNDNDTLPSHRSLIATIISFDHLPSPPSTPRLHCFTASDAHANIQEIWYRANAICCYMCPEGGERAH